MAWASTRGVNKSDGRGKQSCSSSDPAGRPRDHVASNGDGDRYASKSFRSAGRELALFAAPVEETDHQARSLLFGEFDLACGPVVLRSSVRRRSGDAASTGDRRHRLRLRCPARRLATPQPRPRRRPPHGRTTERAPADGPLLEFDAPSLTSAAYETVVPDAPLEASQKVRAPAPAQSGRRSKSTGSLDSAALRRKGL
jgi:hypothetical protein